MLDIGIKTPLTPDGLCGYDQHGQLWVWEKQGASMSGHMIRDPRGQICRVCLQGWVLTSESMKDQYKDRHDDWLHYSCYIRSLSMKDRDLFSDALIGARIRYDGLKEIASQYWRNDTLWAKRSWYVTKTDGAPIQITIGSRKRVYSVEFTPQEDGEFSASVIEDLKREFREEDVTKEFNRKSVLLHAWTGEKLKEYLKRLSTAFGLDKREENPVEAKQA
jgi:hypothetical protein